MHTKAPSSSAPIHLDLDGARSALSESAKMPIITPNQALDDDRRVQEIRLVTYTRGASGPNTSDNHWAIVLVLGVMLSIRIDMTAEFPDPTGHL